MSQLPSWPGTVEPQRRCVAGHCHGEVSGSLARRTQGVRDGSVVVNASEYRRRQRHSMWHPQEGICFKKSKRCFTLSMFFRCACSCRPACSGGIFDAGPPFPESLKPFINTLQSYGFIFVYVLKHFVSFFCRFTKFETNNMFVR